MERGNLLDAEFKTLMIRMLRELTDYSNTIKEEMKVTLSEIKKNLQGTNSGGDEAKNQINDLEHKKEINIQPEQKEETRILKNEDSIVQDSETSSNIPTSKSQGNQKRKTKKVETFI